METLNKFNKVLAWPLVALVWVYQRTLSPDHGLTKVFYPHGYCKFYPSCSEYARLTLLTRGLIGIPKITSRIIRCNPLNIGGVDLPPRRNI